MATTMCVKMPEYYDLDQYNNPANAEAYYCSLGPEVLPGWRLALHSCPAMPTFYMALCCGCCIMHQACPRLPA